MKFKPLKKNRIDIHILCTYICRIKLLRLSMFSIQLLEPLQNIVNNTKLVQNE